jgi:hypothetical protein
MCCRSSTNTPRPELRASLPARILVALWLAGCVLASVAGAQPLPNDTLDQRAREILAIHCAPCREGGSLDLATIARDPKLVRPGNPDGSLIYTEMVRGLVTLTAPPTVDELAILRAWIEKLPPRAAAKSSVPAPSDTMKTDITPDSPIELQLYADRARYKVGDEVRLTIRTDVDCRLTVISIDVAGHGTVIFPNDFATKDLVTAHFGLSLPAPNAGYRFRLKEKGRERVVALCTRAAGLVDGITHDFERQRFQELGPYSTFLDTALRDALKRKADAAEGDTHAPLHQIWRTGIVIEVE